MNVGELDGQSLIDMNNLAVGYIRPFSEYNVWFTPDPTPRFGEVWGDHLLPIIRSHTEQESS